MIIKATTIIAVLLLLLIVPSVMAIPKTKEPKAEIPNNPKKEKTIFTTSAILVAGDTYLGNQEFNENGILSIQDAVSIGKITGEESPISGFEILTILSGTFDPNTYYGTYHGQWIISSPSGSFEGTINGKVTVANIYGQFIGKGTGAFEDQMIRGTFEGSVNDYQVEITIQATITHKIN